MFYGQYSCRFCRDEFYTLGGCDCPRALADEAREERIRAKGLDPEYQAFSAELWHAFAVECGQESMREQREVHYWDLQETA